MVLPERAARGESRRLREADEFQAAGVA